jgi:hypothetical protein
MTKEQFKKVKKVQNGPLGWIFFTAWVGALVYFVQHSDGFGGFVLAILKSIVWPAYVIHAVLGLLHLS